MAGDFLTESGDLGFLGSKPLRDAGEIAFGGEVRKWPGSSALPKKRLILHVNLCNKTQRSAFNPQMIESS